MLVKERLGKCGRCGGREARECCDGPRLINSVQCSAGTYASFFFNLLIYSYMRDRFLGLVSGIK